MLLYFPARTAASRVGLENEKWRLRAMLLCGSGGSSRGSRAGEGQRQ
jgi:hypothetical protein